MGCQAVKTLLALIAGQQVPEATMIPKAELVLRQSCGCFYQMLKQAAETPIDVSAPSLEQAIVAQRDRIITDLEQALSPLAKRGYPAAEWSAQIVDTFIESLSAKKAFPSPFLYALDNILRHTAKESDDALVWHKATSVLSHYTLPYLKDGSLTWIVELWHKARLLIGTTKHQREMQQKLVAEQQAETLRDVCEALFTTFDLASLMESIACQLPRLGIGKCFVSLYDHEMPRHQPGSPSEWARLVLAYEENARKQLETGGIRYPTSQLIPYDLLSQERRYHLLVDSLYFSEQLFGFIVFDAGPPERAVYAPLRTQISAALKVAFLQQGYRRAEQNLARSNQELEQFTYISSHDLQEPLRMVNSYLQLLERRYWGQLDADADEFINFATGGASRMQDLIKDLLQYSRIITHGKPFVPTDFNRVLQQALINLDAELSASSAQVSFDTLPMVLADELQMIQLFQNLIGNAIQFRSEQPPEIHIGAQRGNGEWQFSVRDNGIGIDSEYFDYIFVIFQRLNSGDPYSGTGIGLALCKKIIERHDGHIWVESEPGQGATFYFTIPIREQEYGLRTRSGEPPKYQIH
ncbi:MAG: hypothetical protein JXB07_07050 [Anaerolineae bacterium]|nr:hypothetical protein [Anaerolineae bacterium]